MRRSIDVILDDGPRVGTLRHELQGRRESAAFEYAAPWLGERSRFALEPGLPLQAGPQFPHRSQGGSLFHGAIADTAPAGWARRIILRDRAGRRRDPGQDGGQDNLSTPSALDLLLAVDDVSRVGALRFRDEDEVFQRAQQEGRRAAPPLAELPHLLRAARAVEAGRETMAELTCLRGAGTSLPGVRPKCTIMDRDGAAAIAKLPGIADERPVPRAEVLALALAGEAGIRAARARIVDCEGLPVALIRRFDRRGGRRVMYISAATMLGADRTEAGSHTYTEIVDAIRRHGADARSDIEELWRRIALSILITNVDDHLRNHGFLHQDRELWRLSPAFDINPSPERSRELKTWISEDSGPGMSIDALMSVTDYFRIARLRALEILGEVARAVEGWRRTGRAIGMTGTELDQFADAFEHPEREAARITLGSSRR